MFFEIILDTLLDGLKVLPFLFLTYLLIELLEHHEKTADLLRRAARFGPIAGAAAGVIPQCGFSTVAANFYASGVATSGTVLAVFLSTSDEMLPVFLAQGTPVALILALLGYKFAVGALVGFAVDLLRRKKIHNKTIEDLCIQEHCHCERGPVWSALRHTVKILLFLLAVTFLINLIVAYVGQDALRASALQTPVAGELLAALVGLIPNCAGSVVIAQLFLQGAMGYGPLLAGLLSSAGVGMLVLFRMNRRPRQNFAILAVLYASSVLFGLLAGLLPWPGA